MIKDELIDNINKFFPEHKKHLMEAIMKYIDKNSNVLYVADLSQRFSFSDADREIVFDSCKTSEEEVAKAVKDSPDIDKNWNVAGKPFYVFCGVLVSYCTNKKDKDIATLILMYMTLMMYTSIHYNIFKYGANKNIMDYTINKTLTNKYKIKQFGTLFRALEDIVKVCYETYLDEITVCKDKDLAYFIAALQTRVKGFVKEIAKKYYENHDSGKYLNYDEDSHDENDFHQMTNDSYMIETLGKKVYLNMINKGINTKILRLSVTKADVSLAKMNNIIEDIIDADDESEIYKFILAIIEYYVLFSGNPITEIYRSDFVTYMHTAYQSNSDASQIALIKSLLDKWMIANANRYGKANYGKTAMNGYKKAFYMYIVYNINMEAKGGLS